MADVVVVGGGPSGLAAAVGLRRAGVPDVVVLDREEQAGGVPRHCAHPGFGVTDLGRVLSGPAYAHAWVGRTQAAGVDVRAASTVTGWTAATGREHRLHVDVTSPDGRYGLDAAAIVLATGCRERPRPARLVPGSRPAGVLTTGQLQQAVHLHHRHVGSRAVVVGAEHVSYSAVLTLATAGCEVVAMTTAHECPTTYAAFDRLSRLRWRFPVLTQTSVTDIRGVGRVRAVEVTHLPSGERHEVACDTVVFTGDWVADHELAREQHVGWDRTSSAVTVDTGGRTDAAGVFAVGNLTHPAERADVCAVGAGNIAGPVVSWLRSGHWPGPGVRISVEAPLRWVSPGLVSDATTPPRGRLVLRSEEFRRLPALVVRQGDRVLWRGRVTSLVPQRSASIPSRWLPAVDRSPGAPDVVVGVH